MVSAVVFYRCARLQWWAQKPRIINAIYSTLTPHQRSSTPALGKVVAGIPIATSSPT
jgi:hypothetical protein